jgi:hypothetical protein
MEGIQTFLPDDVAHLILRYLLSGSCQSIKVILLQLCKVGSPSIGGHKSFDLWMPKLPLTVKNKIIIIIFMKYLIKSFIVTSSNSQLRLLQDEQKDQETC